MAQPTTLKRLAELMDRLDNVSDAEHVDLLEELGDVNAWLTWTYNFLSSRKEYHRKNTIKSAMLRKMAETLLSKTELEAIDAQAEAKLTEEEAVMSNDHDKLIALADAIEKEIKHVGDQDS